jgi:hypothetical protein
MKIIILFNPKNIQIFIFNLKNISQNIVNMQYLYFRQF